jgi:hypothetical protein
MKIFGIIIWSIFLVWNVVLLCNVGIDEFDGKRYLYIDMELETVRLSFIFISILFILLNILWKPYKKIVKGIPDSY